MVSLKYLGDRILLGADWLDDWLGMRNVSLRWLEGWGVLASHEWFGIGRARMVFEIPGEQ